MNEALRKKIMLTRFGVLFQSPLRIRFASGVFWSAVAAVINQGTNLVAAIIVARIIGQVKFGELSIITTAVLTFGILGSLGLSITAIKYVADFRLTDPERAGSVVGFLSLVALVSGGIVSAAIFWFAPSLADKVLNAPQLVDELRVSCGLLFFNALGGVQQGTLIGLEAFRPVALINLIGGVAGVGLNVIGAWRWGVVGAVGGYALTAALTWLISQIVLARELNRKGLAIHYNNLRRNWSLIWKFAIPSVIIALSSQPFALFVRIMLTSQPNGYAQLGIFTAAFAWSNILMFLPQQISRPVIPIMSDLLVRGQTKSVTRFLRLNLAITMGVSVLVAIPLMLFSAIIMGAFGDSFSAGSTVLIVILAAFVFGAGTLVFRDILSSASKMWPLAALAIVWGVCLVASTQVLLPQGAMGLALAYLISYVALFLVEAIFLKRTRNIFTTQPIRPVADL